MFIRAQQKKSAVKQSSKLQISRGNGSHAVNREPIQLEFMLPSNHPIKFQGLGCLLHTLKTYKGNVNVVISTKLSCYCNCPGSQTWAFDPYQFLVHGILSFQMHFGAIIGRMSSSNNLVNVPKYRLPKQDARIKYFMIKCNVNEKAQHL